MASAQPLTDHGEIREWAEARDARPACVKGTGGKNDPGMIRLDFPGFSGGDSLQKISWKEWFRQFDENNLALLVQEQTSRGETSNFNKLVKRTAAARTGGRKRAAGTRKTSAPSTTARSRTASGGSKRGTGSRAAASGSSGARARKSTRTAGRSASAKSKSRSSGARTTSRTRTSGGQSSAARKSAARKRTRAQ